MFYFSSTVIIRYFQELYKLRHKLNVLLSLQSLKYSISFLKQTLTKQYSKCH